MKELTEIQHKTRTRILLTVAITAALGLGAFAIFGVDLASKSNQTDAPFWQRLWSGTRTALHIQSSTSSRNTNVEIRALEQKVFPQFENQK